MSVFYNFTKGITLTLVLCCFSMTSFSQTCVEDAPVVACGDVVTGNTQGGSPDTSLPFCGTTLTTAPGNWYIFQGTGDTINITASTAGSSYDTKLGVFTGSCASLTCVGGNDDFGGLTSRVVFQTVPNQNYYIYVTGYSSNAGAYTLSVTCNVQVSVDSDCYIVYNGYAGCTDIMATASYGTPPYTFNWSDGSEGVGINVCPTENTDYTVTVTDAAGGTATAVARVVYVPQDISCGRNKVQICHKDGKGRGRTICVAAAAVPAHLAHGDTLGSCDETYYTCSTPPSCTMITSPMDGAVDVSMPVTVEWEGAMGLVDGYWVSVGTTMGGNDVVDNVEGGLDLMHTLSNLSFETTYYVSVTPYNGNGMAEGCEGISFTTQMNPCNMAPSIACDETATGSTAGGLVFNVGTCGTSLNTAPGVWYAFTGTGDNVTVDTNGSSYDTKLGVFTGGCDALVCLDGDDDGGNGLQSLVTFTSIEGVEYLFYVTGFSSNAGDYVLNVACETPPPPLTNDDPSGAIALSVSSTCNYTSGTNVGATPTAGVTAPGCAFYSGGDVWFTATTVSGNMTIQGDNNGGFTDGGMAVYTGTPGSLVLYACNDDSGPGLHPLINYVGSPGDTVYIRYWEYGNNSFGTFAICAFDAGARPESEGKDIASNTGTIDWSMAPNPTRGDVTLNLSNYLRNNVTVEVIDFTGKVISSESVRDLQTARYTLELNNSLPSGMYLVRVATDSQVSSKKLVIMR